MYVPLKSGIQSPVIAGDIQRSRGRAAALAMLVVGCVLAGVPSHSQAASSAEAQRKWLMLYQVYATAHACITEGYYFNPEELPDIGDAIEKSLSELILSEEERIQLWTSAQRILQITPTYPALCLDARQWLALSVPGAFAGSGHERPF